MTLGIAATSSTRKTNVSRTIPFVYWVSRTAIPMLTGAPIMSAMKLVSTVPLMNGSAPNCSLVEFQLAEVRKPTPNCSIDGIARSSREPRMTKIIPTMTIPAKNVSVRNAESIATPSLDEVNAVRVVSESFVPDIVTQFGLKHRSRH